MKPESLSDEATRMPTKEEYRAFDLGAKAFQHGATIDANPYPKWDENRLPHNLACMWICGWSSEEKEVKQP